MSAQPRPRSERSDDPQFCDKAAMSEENFANTTPGPPTRPKTLPFDGRLLAPSPRATPPQAHKLKEAPAQVHLSDALTTRPVEPRRANAQESEPLAPSSPSLTAPEHSAPLQPEISAADPFPAPAPQGDPALTKLEPADRPALPPRSLPPEVAPALTELAREGGGGVEVALSPEELGSVTLRMEQEGAGLRVTLSADRPETLDLMRRHAGHLQQELADAGFAGATFSFGKGEKGGERQADRPPPRGTEPGAAVAFPRLPAPVSRGSGLDLRM